MTSTYFVVGDVATLGNTFKVNGTNTDPTTVSLAVTDPAGTTTTYTYAAAQITKTATGVYSKDITVDAAGTWEYKWTGTGAAADVADGSFEVWMALTTPAYDIISLGEAKQALNIDLDTTTFDRELAAVVTAASQRIVDLCGEVVNRTYTDEAHNGGGHAIFLRHAPSARSATLTVSAVKEYTSSGSLTSLTEETAATKQVSGFVVDAELGAVRRMSSGSPACFASGARNILVTYTAGRAATTAVVPAKFKQACAELVKHMWAGRGSTANFVGDEPTGFIVSSRVAFDVVSRTLADELRPPVVA